ncbi:hypothetical protein B0H16DRAFT_1775026, partial [Mycena metata]
SRSAGYSHSWYALTHQNLIPAVILLFSLVSLGDGVWTMVMVLITGKFSRIPMLYRSAQVWLISAACTDIAIALSLWLALRSKKTGFVLTDHVVDTIIRMTVQTGMLTYTVCQSAYSSSSLSQSALQYPGCCLLPDLVDGRSHGHANIVLTGPMLGEDSKARPETITDDTPGASEETEDRDGGIRMTKIVECV